MSLIVTQDQLVVRVLDAPVFVYKVAYRENNDHRSYIQGYIYKRREVMIAREFDSTVRKINRCKKVYKSFPDKVFQLEHGFHSFVNVNDAQKYLSAFTKYGVRDLVILKCIIPSGTRCVDGSFENIYKEVGRVKNILSEKLYFLKEITS
jgi:hypothetical protein